MNFVDGGSIVAGDAIVCLAVAVAVAVVVVVVVDVDVVVSNQSKIAGVDCIAPSPQAFESLGQWMHRILLAACSFMYFEPWKSQHHYRYQYR